MEIRKNGDGTTSFRVKVRLQNRRYLTKSFLRKTDAINWKRNLESELAKNEALGIAPLKENLLFKDFFNLWMERKILHVRSEKTIADYRSAGRKHFFGSFGDIPVRTIDKIHADILIRDLKSIELTPKTINKILALFKQILQFAEDDGFVSKSPLRKFPRLKVTSGRIEYLSLQESIQLLRANATEEIYPLLVVTLNTGLRIGEVTGLCWDRVNFQNDYIEISRTLTRTQLKDVTKTHLIRYIPMNSEVKSVLLKLIQNQKSPQFVFARDNGKPFNPDHYTQREFLNALKRAGVRPIHFHDLRHTYASQFMMNSGQPYDLKNILGHTNIEMTQKYAHLSPQHLRKAVDTVRLSADGNKGVCPLLAPQTNDVPKLKVVSDEISS